LKGTQNLLAELTIRDGRVIWDRNGLTREDWEKLGNYTAQGDRRWDGTLGGAIRARRR
jgi:hypothetical protein